MNIVIIGSSAASKSAVETIRRYQAAPHHLTVITKDVFPYYSRVLLPNYVAGQLDEKKLSFVSPHFVDENSLRIIHGTVVQVNTADKTVQLEEGERVSYDRLLICSGAVSEPVPVEGNQPDGVFQLRHLEEARKIRAMMNRGADCVVVGGGLIGLKAAWALNSMGKKVTVIHRSSQLLSTFMDETGSRMARELLNRQGINTLLDDTVSHYKTRDGRVAGVELNSGTCLPAQMVIWAAGVAPNHDFLGHSAVKTHRGILVNDKMETSAKDVYAAGDVAEATNLLTQDPDTITLWTDAGLQGKVAAWNLLGMERLYPGGLTMNSVVFNEVPFISMGTIREREIRGCEVWTGHQRNRSVYRKIVLKDGRIIGAVFVGDVRYAGMVNWDIRSGRLVKDPSAYVSLVGLESVYRDHHGDITDSIPFDTHTQK